MPNSKTMTDRIRQRCYDIENKEKTIVYWTDKQLTLADYLRHIGVMCMIEGIGWVYKFSDLDKAMKNMVAMED